MIICFDKIVEKAKQYSSFDDRCLECDKQEMHGINEVYNPVSHIFLPL